MVAKCGYFFNGLMLMVDLGWGIDADIELKQSIMVN